MDIKEIKELIRLIEQSAIEEFEMERSGVRVRLRKPVGGTVLHPAPAQSIDVAVPRQAEEEAEAQPTAAASHYIFKSPIVGTYYASSKPDADPFVRVGDTVTKGTVLCIVEAMKLFNQIESDVDGEIAMVLVENGQPVEYGEPLFEIRTS